MKMLSGVALNFPSLLPSRPILPTPIGIVMAYRSISRKNWRVPYLEVRGTLYPKFVFRQ